MHHPSKLRTLCAFSILAVPLAGLITYSSFSNCENPTAPATENAAVTPLVSASTNSAETQEQTKSWVEASYGNLPLSFEPNRGQTDRRVKFLSRAGDRTLWLTNDEAVLAIGRPKGVGRRDAKQEGVGRQGDTPAVLRMRFVGANGKQQIKGEARQLGTVNYFVGKPKQWRTKIPTYARVRYHSLYPGIDLVFYGNNRELEYDLVVSPGADPRRIKLAVAGAEEIRIDAEGNLVLKTSQGEVTQQKPRIYQRKGTTLIAVAGDYVMAGKDEVGFRLGSYDRKAAVVIDPVLRYSAILGGRDIDQGTAIAVDSSNRAVVAGITCSPDFPATDGHTPPSTGLCSAFVTKFDFTGSRLIFSSFVGESAFCGGLALDSAGNPYITGQTSSSPVPFPTTPGAFQRTFGGDNDAFVTKLSANGSTLIYSTFLGGSNSDAGSSIAVDSAGNAYVTGSTDSSNFPTTAGVFQQNCKLQVDGLCQSGFVTKLNALGSRALYSTFLGGHGSQQGAGIDVDEAGNAFVTGATTASDFPTTAGSAQPVFHGGTDAFVSELSSSGSHLIYSTFLGGGDIDSGSGIALDSMGNAFVAGSTRSTDFPVKNAFQPHCAIAVDVCINAFVIKLDPSGRLLYSTFLGGGVDGGELGTGIAVTPGGQAYVTGFTRSTHFPTTQTAFQRVPGGENDIFLTKFSPAGQLIYSSYLGGSGSELSSVVALDRSTNAYLTGIANFEISGPGPTFPVTPGAFHGASGGAGDAFVAKVVALCALSTVNRTVTICSPGNGSTVKSPVNIVAGTTDATPVKLIQVYLDGRKIYETPLSAINVNLPITGGTHRLTVQGLDTAGVFFKKPISINVSPH